MNKKLTLDEFLQEAGGGGYLCLVEPAGKESDKVKLTPWAGDSHGCNCDSAITIDKTLIEGVVQTDHSRLCCGKQLKVVEVIFKETASIKISDVIEMVLTRAATYQQGMPQPFYEPVPPSPFPTDAATFAPASFRSASFAADESAPQDVVFQASRFPPTLPKCGWRKVVCGSALPGYPVPMCWEYYCYFPGSSRNVIF